MLVGQAARAWTTCEKWSAVESRFVEFVGHRSCDLWGPCGLPFYEDGREGLETVKKNIGEMSKAICCDPTTSSHSTLITEDNIIVVSFQ